ncbi:Baeyer-Villiger monooxygenase [Orchesella cincta]|uniref:Flavin-containing monooxygenase n=1 Tax=Orchesella cincta TaxID=48709 RepID=A0A1D2MKA9_ORCCI|nr:Baeyer-Villiger monooxygenase [Orchesella cincta]
MEGKEKTICIVGAGFSGLCTAIKIKKKLPNYSITIYDTNADFGGTWLVNTYPGCACDIPSHLYSFSFEPNPSWSSQYPSQVEILTYMKTLARKYSLYENAKFRHEVKQLEWLEETMKWKASVLDSQSKQLHSLCYDFVFCGTGEYHIPKTPEIFNSFQGSMMHSAEWQPQVELEGKTVAVVGSGASAIQIIPNIASQVGKLLSYQRTPPWVIGRLQFNFAPLVQWAFAKIPGMRRFYRNSIYLANEIQYPVFQIQGFLSHIARPIAVLLGKLHLRRQVSNRHLRAKLLPNYSFGCNRVCLSSDYYPALTRENVEVIRDDIIQVTHDSIVTKDRREKIDVLILATGFDIHEYFGPMEIVGRKGENILRKWKVDKPSIYLGIASHLMPNLFFIHGPGVSLNEIERRGASAISVKESVEKAYMLRHQRDMKNTVWSSNDCGSYYANSQNVITIVYPRSQIDYWLRTLKFNPDNFEFLMQH